MGELGDVDRIVAVGQQCPDRVADTDDAVGGGRSHPGQQPRPPGTQDLPPRPAGSLAPEERRPVGDAPRVTERFRPVRADRAAAAGELLQPPHVAVQPRAHGLGVAVADHRLGGHRAVVGQPAVKFRPGLVQPLVGLVQYPCRIGCHVISF